MQPQLIILDSPEEVEALQEYLAPFDHIAFDTETTGLTTRDEIIGYSVCAEDDRAFYVVLARWNKDKACLEYTDAKEASRALIESLKGKSLWMHNGSFDCMMVEAFFKVRLINSLEIDSMILAHLLDENRRVGLKELAKEYLGLSAADEQKEMRESVFKNGGTITKDKYEMFKCDTPIMAKYGAKDAWLTRILILNHLLPDLIEQGLEDFFFKDESMPLLRGPTYQLNTTGLQVDTNRLTSLKKQLQAECLEAKDFIYQEINPHVKEKYPGTNKTNTFNIGASQQLSWLLFGKLNLEFHTLTKGGKTACRALGLKLPYTFSARRDFISRCQNEAGSISQPEALVNGKVVKAKKFKEPWAYIAVDKTTLKKLSSKHKWIEKLLEYQRKMKILSTYVEGIESRIQYGIIRPNFLQHGTTSGRYSSRSPNFQNLPRDDKRIKEAIIARPGRVFVGADYSQLEPRVFAYFSNDTRLLAAFEGDDDFYSVIGMEVYGKSDCIPRKDGSPEAFGIKYKKLRDLSKVIALASTYGATANQLAPTTGKSIEDTQLDIENYFERFPGVAQMMLNSHKKAKTQGFVTNLFGRKRRMPEAMRITKLYGNVDHGDLPYEARSLLNLAVNHQIQSTGASIVNRAAIAFHRNALLCDIQCNIVVQVHDSLVVECDAFEAEEVSILLQQAMENTVQLPGIKLEAIPKIGKTLAEV